MLLFFLGWQARFLTVVNTSLSVIRVMFIIVYGFELKTIRYTRFIIVYGFELKAIRCTRFIIVCCFELKAIRYEVLNWTVAKLFETCSAFNIFAKISDLFLLISFQVTRSLPCRSDWSWKCNNDKFTVLRDVTPFSLVDVKDFEDPSVLFLYPQEERRVLHATAWEPEI